MSGEFSSVASAHPTIAQRRKRPSGKVEKKIFDHFRRNGNVFREVTSFTKRTCTSDGINTGFVSELPSGGKIFEVSAVRDKIDEFKWFSIKSEVDNF